VKHHIEFCHHLRLQHKRVVGTQRQSWPIMELGSIVVVGRWVHSDKLLKVTSCFKKLGVRRLLFLGRFHWEVWCDRRRNRRPSLLQLFTRCDGGEFRFVVALMWHVNNGVVIVREGFIWGGARGGIWGIMGDIAKGSVGLNGRWPASHHLVNFGEGLGNEGVGVVLRRERLRNCCLILCE